MKQVEPYLYPRTESLLPYYLAILIHTAGNPDPIAELDRDCLQPLPLLDDREALVIRDHLAHLGEAPPCRFLFGIVHRHRPGIRGADSPRLPLRRKDKATQLPPCRNSG